MIIIKNETKPIEQKTCVALGNFDGVHKGHKKLITSLTEYANKSCLMSCVYTFETHPSEFLGTLKPMLTVNSEKIKIMESLNCDYLYLENFTDVMDMSPSEFCKKIINEKLNAKCVFCGENYRFGKSGEGDINILKNELSKYGINLVVIPYIKTAGDTVISSSRIRECIKNGDLQSASDMLGYNYFISGDVVMGKKLGRTLGFPTVNIPIQKSKLVPKLGVYVSECIIDGKKFHSVTNIGIRPTIENDNHSTNCETYIFNYSGEAYDKHITVSLISLIRPEMKFDSVEKLKSQISKDITYAEKFIKDNNRSI